MTHHRRPFVTLVRTRLHGCGPISLRNKKKQIPTPSYAYPPSPEAAWPLIRLPPFPPRIVGLPRYAFPRHRPRRATSLHTPLTYVPITCATHLCPSHLRRSLSLAVYPSPIVVGRAADPTMAAGEHMPWRLRSSPTKPRSPTSVAGVGGARASRLAAGSHPNNRNRPAPVFPFLML
jgi:hypothetical protein